MKELVKERFILVSIIQHGRQDEEIFEELKELKELMDSYGGQAIEFVLQRREVHDKGKYIGSGKINEIVQIIKKERIDVVVFNGIIKPGHLFDIQRVLQQANPLIKVWDRSDLILEIFAKHAHTAEAKLQIELAAMRHMGPRIYGMGSILSSQGGGIGTRGIGETNTELMRRHWKVQMRKTKDKLAKLSKQRNGQLKRRKRVGIPTVSLVGYTNAGKTSIFNLLSGKKKFADKTLFATLDTVTSKLFFPHSQKEAILTDTIGFIHNLPPMLIDAFESTLLEAIHADLLLVVIDCSDPAFRKKIDIVENPLLSLPVRAPKRIYVFNKMDQARVEGDEIMQEFEANYPQLVSAKTKFGIPELKRSIEVNLNNT